ncbi:MAG: DEAD/DEAH box helicase, partial [Actinobacteria bacterium]|nr:DEAD/DEAH box helicase [Actinomycetota bacterium]
GILDCNGSTGLPRRSASRNDKNQNLLVIAPTSSGKTFIGEMAAIAQVIHLQKIIYLVPLRALADEKYRHFENLYRDCGIDIVISTRDRKEDDHHIISGDYDVAVIAYEKFYYFCLMCPQFLDIVSLVIIDEMQLINDSKWGPLLEDIVFHIDTKNKNIKIIALSAFIEEQEALLRWFPARTLISYQRPVELRKGIVRGGVFQYITSKKKENCKKEVFFKPEAVRENCFEDYLLETVRYLVKQGESVLIFFATCAETQKWARWLASQLETPAASCALKELKEMEDTLSRDELRETLEKGIAHYNQNLSWEERNLIETYQKEGEIKVICATSIMAMGINLHFKNVIIAMDKIYNDEGNYPLNYRTSLTFAAIENMGGRAGILNLEDMRKSDNSFNFQNMREFGRVIFLAHSLLFQTIYKNLYFKSLRDNNYNHKANKQLVNIDNDFLTYLLRVVVNVNFKHIELKINLIKEEFVSQKNQSKSDDKNILSGYWQFAFNNKANIPKKIDNCLNILRGNRLIRMNRNGVLSPTDSGILIAAKRIKVETFLFFKSWLRYCKNEDISILEILFLLALSPDGKALPIPFSQAIRDDYKKGIYQDGCKKNYWNKLLHLIFEQGDEDKKLFRDKILMKKENEEINSLEDYITFMKTHLLYDWVEGKKSVKTIEEEYGLYRGCIYRLGEGFSWLADSLLAIAESVDWEKKYSKDLNKIKMLSYRLAGGVQEEGLDLALLYIPGLSRYHIRKLVEAGYGDENSFKDASGGELGKLIPKRLVQRIQKKMKEDNNHLKILKAKWIVQDEKLKAFKKVPEESGISIRDRQSATASPVILLEPLLEISQRRPDRIIFMGKEAKITARGFSLLYFLAQHKQEVVSYNSILDELWKDEEDAIYTRIISHIYKFRIKILDAIGHNKENKEKVKDIFKVISGRGVMLNINDKELQIS